MNLNSCVPRGLSLVSAVFYLTMCSLLTRQLVSGDKVNRNRLLTSPLPPNRHTGILLTRNQKSWANRPIKQCVACKRMIKIAAKGLCMRCYVYPRFKDTLYKSNEKYRKKPENIAKRKIYNAKWKKEHPDYHKNYCKWWRAKHGGKAWTKKDPRKKQQPHG